MQGVLPGLDWHQSGYRMRLPNPCPVLLSLSAAKGRICGCYSICVNQHLFRIVDYPFRTGGIHQVELDGNILIRSICESNMNPRYHWVTESMELLTFSAIEPALAIVIAYRAWRQKESINQKRCAMRCVASGGTALLLFGLAKWIDADIRKPQYFVQLACVLVSFILWGVCQGQFFSVLVGVWRRYGSTRQD